MAAKTFLKVKRGLYLDPVHHKRIGARIWLFLYILDQANWETGLIDFWKDADAAAKLDLPKRTIKDQRQDLETEGYISCLVKGQHQEITIFNYLSPRTGEILNPRTGGESYISVEADPTEWDIKVSHSPDNQDTFMSQSGDSVPQWDTFSPEGDSKDVPLPLTLDLIKQNEVLKPADIPLNDALRFALGELQLQGVSRADYENYLLPLQLKGHGNGSITLSIGNRYAKDLIEKRYLHQLQAAMSGSLGKPINLRIETC